MQNYFNFKTILDDWKSVFQNRAFRFAAGCNIPLCGTNIVSILTELKFIL
jgi:hypothetical protein